MPGIIPEATAGGRVIRAGGVCTNPNNVTNAFCPPPAFNTTCDLTALPSDCTARITPAQINAIVSELISFAACLTPTGTWNCGSLQNLCTAFNAWKAANNVVDGDTIIGTGTVADPWRVDPAGLAAAICANDPAADALAACLLSTDAGNASTTGTDGRILTSPASIANSICANDAAADALAACLIEPGAANLIDQGPTGRLEVSSADIAAGICADDASADALAACLISTSPGNAITVGPDGRVFFDGTGDPLAQINEICAAPTAKAALIQCVLSGDANNQIILGADGELFVAPAPPLPDDPFVASPAPNVVARHTDNQGDVVDLPAVDPVVKQMFPYSETRNDPVGSSYLNVWLPNQPDHVENLVNPWPDRSAKVLISGSVRADNFGWGASPGINTIDAEASVNGTSLALVGVYTGEDTSGSEGTELLDVFELTLPPGGNVNVTFRLSGAIIGAADATASALPQHISHSYVVEYHRFAA